MTTYYGHLSAVLRKRGGELAADTTVNVYAAGTTNAATLYRDRAGATAITNPVAIDRNGQLDAYLAPAAYDLVPVNTAIPPILGVVVQPDVATVAVAATAGAVATALTAVGALTTTAIEQLSVTADAAQRHTVTADGKHQWGNGTDAVDTNLYRTAADILRTDDSMSALGFKVTEGGAAARMGVLTLNGATPVVVATTAVSATSRIFLTTQTVGGVPTGAQWVSARTPGTSFSVTGIAADTSVVAWVIVEPA